MKYVKVFVLSILALLLLCLAGVGLALKFVNPNDYRDRIASVVEKSIARKIVFTGKIELSYYPWLGFKLGELYIQDLPQFGQVPIVKLQSAGLKIDFLSLLQGDLKVQELLLDGVEVNLIANEREGKNWILEKNQTKTYDAGNLATEAQEQGSAQNLDKASKNAPKNINLAISNISFVNSKLNYTDLKHNIAYVFSINQAKVTDFILGQDFKLDINGEFESSSDDLTLTYKLDTKLKYDQPKDQTATLGHVYAKDFILNTVLKNQALPKEGLALDLVLEKLSFEPRKHLNFSGLFLNLPGFRLEGSSNLELSELHSFDSMSGVLKLNSNPQKMLAALGHNVAFKNANSLDKLSLDFDFSAKNKAETDGIALANAELSPNKIANKPFDLSQLEAQLNIKGELDESILTGSVLYSFDKKANFDLKFLLDKLNLDDYLVLKNEAQKEQNSQNIEPAQTLNQQEPIALSVKSEKNQKSGYKELLKAVSAKLTFAIKKLTIQNNDLEYLELLLLANDGVLDLSRCNFSLYQDAYKSSGTLNLLTTPEKGTLNLDFNKINAAQVLNALGKKEILDSGTASLKANLQFKGLDSSAISRSLTGNSRFVLNGATLNSAVTKKATVVLDKIPPALLAGVLTKLTGKNSDGTQMSELLQNIRQLDLLSATFNIVNGVASNNDLKIKASTINGSGQGQINLPENSINYRLNFNQIPVNVAGKLNSPSVSVDPAVLSNLLQDVLNHPEGAKQGAKQLLRGILGIGK